MENSIKLNSQREGVANLDLRSKFLEKSLNATQTAPNQATRLIKQSSKTSSISSGGQGGGNNQNCIIEICYNGEPRQFALSGQLLQSDENFESIPEFE
jgi:hypothetical protein